MDLLPSGDAMAIKIFLGEWPEVKPEMNADLWGLCGCAGEAEGVACVCFIYEDLKEVQPGEILICPAPTRPGHPCSTCDSSRGLLMALIGQDVLVSAMGRLDSNLKRFWRITPDRNVSTPSPRSNGPDSGNPPRVLLGIHDTGYTSAGSSFLWVLIRGFH